MNEKIKCSACAYACSREEGKYHVCRYPDEASLDAFVNPTGDWVPMFCPKIKATKDNQETTQ